MINGESKVLERFNQHYLDGDRLIVCPPVIFELERGFKYTNATRKSAIFEYRLLPLLERVALTDDDWLLAAQYWAETRRAGKQFSDVDLLLAALTARLSAILVSSDDDFGVLPIQRQNWRS